MFTVSFMCKVVFCDDPFPHLGSQAAIFPPGCCFDFSFYLIYHQTHLPNLQMNQDAQLFIFSALHQSTGSAFTHQWDHVLIFLHEVPLLITAVPLHLVGPGEPALLPVWAGPPDFHGKVTGSGEFTPVEDSEPIGSFTVKQRAFMELLLVRKACS